MSIQPKKAGEIESLSAIEMSMQLMALTQAHGVQQRSLADQVNQASQKVIHELGMQIESLKAQNASLQEQLRVSEDAMKPAIAEDIRCVQAHQYLVTQLKKELKTSQNNVEMRRKTAKEQLHEAKYYLSLVESSLEFSKDIAQGTVTKRWLDAHRDWK